uniref:MADF domain-containing protein n=1 Tax=Heterorhabditis bacteriophora TaxID=37862 RepID=A0A1I7XR98_HETBA
MEVVNSPTRRAPPASQQVVIVSVPSSQPSSNQGEQYQLTELKNVTSKPLSSVRRTTSQNYEPKPAVTPLEPAIEEDLTEARGRSQPQAPLQGGSDEAFQLRLIDAIRNEPCLYDPSDEHYGNKHTSAQFRAQVWVQIARDIQWQDDTHLLQMQWKRLRDRYVRRKRRSNEDPSRERHPSDGDRIIDAMRWLDQYLVDSSERNSTSTSQGSSQVPPSREVYYVEPQTMDQDVMISGYSTFEFIAKYIILFLIKKTFYSLQNNISLGYIIVRPNSVSASGPHQTIRLVTNTNNDVTGSPHSSSSDISVGSSGATKGQSLAVMSSVQSGGSQVQQIQSRTQPRVHIIHAPSSQNHQSSQYVQKVVQSAEPGITVTASGSAGMVGQVKKGDYIGKMSLFK